MTLKLSVDYSPPFPKGFHTSLKIRHNQHPAFIQPGSRGSPELLSRFHVPQAKSSSVDAYESNVALAVSCTSTPCSRSELCSSNDYFDEALAYLPLSSTPDLLPQNADNPSSSPVFLSQESFTKRLHALLQAILDKEREEESSPEGPIFHGESYKSEDEGDEQKYICGGTDEGGSTSHMSEDSLSPSPRNMRPQLRGVHADSALTHKNKRKHDFYHGFSEGFSDLDATIVDEEEELLPNRKKSKTEIRSASTSFSESFIQPSESVSSMKLRTSRSTSLSFSTVGVTVVDSHCLSPFVHPLIHPTVNSLHIPKSKCEVAETRIKHLLQREASSRIQDGLPPGPFKHLDFSSDEHHNKFGIEPHFRRTVVEWILEVLPSRYLKPHDLRQHLKYSEETRFHAIYLFTRFFLRLAECSVRRGKLETKSAKAARIEITWHVAFCCLAISIKFHHDFLFPLSPICSRNFLAMAPQLLTHERFERIERNVLNIFDYEVYGVTPHAFFEELQDAVPSLQGYMKCKTITWLKTWDLLRIAALEWDIMRFPLSLLSAAALLESILITLVYEHENEDYSCCNGSDSCARPKNICSCSSTRREIIFLSQEISTLLGTTVTDLEVCRHWLISIVNK